MNDYGLRRREVALLAGRHVGAIYVIGDADTGKTTLAGAVAEMLRPNFATAMVDLDAGQASIGLPTTFGWKMSGSSKPAGLYFTGTTSPVGHFDQSIAGAAALVAEARARAAKVVIDTCGLARGELGRKLHHATVEAVRPDVVVAIERSGELSDLLEPLIRAGWPLVVRASVPAQVVRRSPAKRRIYRRDKFRAYFERARELRLNLGEVGVLRPRPDPVGRIAALRDRRGRDVALAIVRKYSPRAGAITVLSPVQRRGAVRAIGLGSMRIARDGRQLAERVS